MLNKQYTAHVNNDSKLHERLEEFALYNENLGQIASELVTEGL
ncbi:hypothetical protein BN2127_JRS1_04275 [Bacillus cereus]|nr:hypothetical protein BN2127_JRS1_04275 [Bacillus cereus]